MTEGRVPPTLPSFKIPNLPNQPQNIPGVAFPNRHVQVFPQTDKAHQSGFPPQQKNITQNTFQLLHPPLTDLPPFHSAPYQNASQWSQFVPEHPSSVPPVLVQGTVANSNATFQTDLPDYHFHSQQRNSSELNLLDEENKVHLLSSYTHETAHDIAGIRPTSMYKNNNPVAPSSSTANSTITEPRVFRNESQFSLDCMSINIQKENQTGYKKDNFSAVPKIDYIGEISSTGLGIFTASNSILDEMESEIYSLAPVSNEVKDLVDNLTDWLIGIQKNDLPSELDTDASSIENLKSNRDKMKLLNDMSRPIDAIPQTVEDLLNDLIQETGELPGPVDEVAGCSMQVNNPQYFHVSRSKSYTDCALQIPQEDTELVTQRAVTNDQVNEMSNSKNKAYNMQEEPSTQNLVIREVQTNSPRLESFTFDWVDLAAPSESLILGLDISLELDGEVLPQKDVDKSNETNSPLEDTFGVEKASATKEVMRTAREMIEETDEHEDKGTENDFDTSREKETNTVQSKQMMDQQTQPESTVAVKMGQMTTEMLEFNTSLEVGNGSRVKEMISAGSLCTSEAELGRDGYTENTESEQHKHNSYSNDQVGVEESKNKVLDSIKKIETKTSGILCESKCDRAKTPRPKGRMKVEMENETAKSSAVVQTLIMEKPIERDRIFKTEHRRLARQSPKKAETDNLFGRKEKNQKTVVKARDGSGGHQESRINKEERQTPRRSERRNKQRKNAQSNTIFVMNTRTRRDFNSLISEDVARTQKVKKTENPNSETDGDTKPPLVEGMKNTQAPDIKSGSNSDIVTGRGTRGKVDVAFVKEKKSSKGDHIYRRSYKTRQHYNMATLEKQVGDRREGAGTTRCSKQMRKCNLCFKGSVKNSSGDTELRSEKTTREGSPEAEEAAVKCSERKEGELKHTPKKHDSAFPVTTEKVKEIKKEASRGKKEPKYEQHKAKDCSGDKRSDKRHTRSYIASLQCQVENKGEEIRESHGRNKGKNQIKESGVKMVLRERPQKEERVHLKEVRNKDAGITRHTVAGSTEGETRKQEMTTGILTSINKSILEQNIERQRKKPRPASNAKTMHGRTPRSSSRARVKSSQ